jgi:hypothetical protein
MVVTVAVVKVALVAALAAVFVALLAGQPAAASSYAQFGVQDDAWLMYGPGTIEDRLDMLDTLGVQVVRLSLRWDQVAPKRPANERDPLDPAYVWGAYGATLDALHAHGIPVVLTLWASPRWANGGHSPNVLPRAGFGNFAYAVAKRFPWIRKWTIWNEPNTRMFASPVSPELYTRRLLNPAYVLLHRSNRANRVAGGVTSPRRTPSGISPLDFMQGMRRYHARLDAYAQNPYPASPRETPMSTPCSWCTTLTMARLPEIRARVTALFGPKPLWLTEYGYQTNPPDRVLGVSPALQARYVGEAALRVWQQPGVTLLIHFMVRDEPSLGGWQSGFFTTHGVAKPSERAYALPFAERSRRGSSVVLWGQVRPGSGHRRYRLERWTGRGWASVGGTRTTDARGALTRVVHGSRGNKFRIRALPSGLVSPLLTVT